MSTESERIARLADLLRAKGLSQRAFAHRIGYSGQAVNQMLRGKRGVSAECALKIQEGFGVRATWLLDGTDPRNVWQEATTTTTEGPGVGEPPILKCPRCYCDLDLRETPCPRCQLPIDWPDSEHPASGRR